ncbi:MAG TPA: cytochrome ubiquinol oxidase subunit I, partial [Fibrobacteraceae bacterium]|nr:cytochrome ubiquinol oxidase subunit I [Fibrobacteraceae bacterium]
GPGNYIPPVTLTYWSFRTMVGSGFALIGLAAFATLFPLILRRSIPRLLLLILPLSMLLPYLANSTGWLVAELGRQPWVVYGLMLLRDGLSPSVSPGEVAISLVVFTLLYATLILTTLKLFWHHSRVGITQADISGAPASH